MVLVQILFLMESCMKPFLPMMMVAFCGVLLAGATGCQSAQPKPLATQPAMEAGVQRAPDPLVAWLQGATKPAVVTCSVEPDMAPVAVERFNALSSKIGGLYASIYQEAQSAAEATATGDVALDNVLAKVAEQVIATDTEATDWKASAQAAVIANYQSVLKEIDAYGKQLSDYTDSLRSDASISNLTSRIQTKVFFQLGKDSVELGRQLKEACEGVSAIRSRRMATALGK